MRVRVSCDLELHLEVATPFILMLRPRSGAMQWVAKESYTFSHPVTVTEYQDIFGNLCQRIMVPAVEFEIHTSAEVDTAPAMDTMPGAPFIGVQDLPVEVLSYLVPTRYCESDSLGDFARGLCGNSLLGYNQVQEMSDWIRQNVSYRPGTSDILLTAAEVLRQRHGVCRDLAHLGIALCRSISIPARMVVGYLVGLEPMDLHAWFEAYVGDRWYGFDPSQSHPDSPRVAIAYGRDAADVAIFHQFGPLPSLSTAIVKADAVGDLP
jgi:transglutaminase-like putative cysteine protease